MLNRWLLLGSGSRGYMKPTKKIYNQKKRMDLVETRKKASCCDFQATVPGGQRTTDI